jgi:Grx4 family monothiol glutaredoxin
LGKKTVLFFWAPWHQDSVGFKTGVLPALASLNPDLSFGCVQAEENAAVANHFGVTLVPTVVLTASSGTIVEKVIVNGENAAQLLTQAVQRLQLQGAAASLIAANTVEESAANVPTAQVDSLTSRMERLIKSHTVMVFMKGIPTNPKCGFSRQLVELLQQEQIAFGSFDILSNEDIRQGLKQYSNWPTYPQLYCSGELVGGLDIVQEMKQQGSLKEQLNLVESAAAADSTTSPPTLEDRLNKLIHQERIMLFMKGLPSAPQCGFSRQIVESLDRVGAVYGAFNIFSDEQVRQGLKTFSNWPTYPQLYVDGELVGGLDIVKEMEQDGSLKETLGC